MSFPLLNANSVYRVFLVFPHFLLTLHPRIVSGHGIATSAQIISVRSLVNTVLIIVPGLAQICCLEQRFAMRHANAMGQARRVPWAQRSFPSPSGKNSARSLGQ